MAKISTNISIDSDIKMKAQDLFADLGIDLSTAINIFLRQAVFENRIPFSVHRRGSCAERPASGGTEDSRTGESGNMAGTAPWETDPLLKAAIELAVENEKCSTSLIQRHLSVGYGRAAGLLCKMEELGIVSPHEGKATRSVLLSPAQWAEMKESREDGE